MNESPLQTNNDTTETYTSETLTNKSMNEIKKKIRNLERILNLKKSKNDKLNQVLINSMELRLKGIVYCIVFCTIVCHNYSLS